MLRNVLRRGPAVLAFLLTAMSPSQPLAGSEQTSNAGFIVYVGTYGEGIYAFRFHPVQGSRLEPLGLTGKLTSPSFIACDRQYRHLYAVSEVQGKGDGAVGAFSIDRRSGFLTQLNTASSAGNSPCHLAVDHTSKMLLVANYGTGGVSAFPLEHDGRLGHMSDLATAQGSSEDPQRQKGPHAHETVISADNRFVYVPDLGLDQIRIYKLDPDHGKLVSNDPAFVKTEPGSGPRHIAFAPNGKHAYSLHELKHIVTVFNHDPKTGTLDPIQTVSTVPPGFTGENAGAEIAVDASGKHLYASNRGPGTIAVFDIDPGNGTLRETQMADTGGTTPRGFEIDPTGRYFFVGDQKSNHFTVMEIEPGTGRLRGGGPVYEVPSPVAFLFVPAS